MRSGVLGLVLGGKATISDIEKGDAMEAAGDMLGMALPLEEQADLDPLMARIGELETLPTGV